MAVLPQAPAPEGSPYVRVLPPEAYNWLVANGWQMNWYPGRGPLRGRAIALDNGVRYMDVWTAQSPADLTHTILHESGHAIDYTMNNATIRQQWMNLRGIGTWTPSDMFFGYDRSYGTGDFAEAIGAVLRSPSMGQPIGVAPLTGQQRQFIIDILPFRITSR